MVARKVTIFADKHQRLLGYWWVLQSRQDGINRSDLVDESIYSYQSSLMTSSNGNIFRVTGLCAGNSPITGEFPSQRPMMRSFDVFFDLRLNKRLSKQSWGWWVETPSSSLCRHCNGSGVCRTGGHYWDNYPGTISSHLTLSYLIHFKWLQVFKCALVNLHQRLFADY